MAKVETLIFLICHYTIKTREKHRSPRLQDEQAESLRDNNEGNGKNIQLKPPKVCCHVDLLLVEWYHHVLASSTL